MSYATAIKYLEQLVAFDSISRNSNCEITSHIQSILSKWDFQTEIVDYLDRHGTPKSNVVAKKGSGPGGLVYFAHSDVVPADDWQFPNSGPFAPFVEGERIYGRGSCDMKGSIACMLAAIERSGDRDLSHPLYFVCTGDEEIGFLGAKEVVQRSSLYREVVENQPKGIVGEPTSLQIVYGHKGIVGIRVRSEGKAAHSSTRDGVNANMAMIPFLAEMKRIHDETKDDTNWNNHEFDPPIISWNIGINDFTLAYNVTPAVSICTISFRHMPGQNADQLIDRVRLTAERHGLAFEVDSRGEPFLTDPHSEIVRQALEISGQTLPQTVSYGTDGGEFSELNQLIVCGPGSIAQAHTVDEWIALDQLEMGTRLYLEFIEKWCVAN